MSGSGSDSSSRATGFLAHDPARRQHGLERVGAFDERFVLRACPSPNAARRLLYVSTAYSSGTKIDTRASGPTSRVAWPSPVRSSAMRMSPTPRRRTVPSPISMSVAPVSVKTA